MSYSNNNNRRQQHQRRRRHDRNGHHKTHENSNNHLVVGTTVSVVQKHDQPTGRLTSGVVVEILTNSAFHPRGIKVRLQDGTVGRIQQPSGDATNSGGDTLDISNNNENYHHSIPPRGTMNLADFMPMQQQQNQERPMTPPPPSMLAVEEDEETGASSSSWPCPACTFLNSSLLTECELCQTRPL